MAAKRCQENLNEKASTVRKLMAMKINMMFLWTHLTAAGCLASQLEETRRELAATQKFGLLASLELYIRWLFILFVM